MKNDCIEFGPEGGVYEVTNDGDAVCEPRYACVTAPSIVKVKVSVEGTLVDVVYAGAGGSHSWWKEAGGGLLKYPLKVGRTLRVEFSGACAFRVDWY